MGEEEESWRRGGQTGLRKPALAGVAGFTEHAVL